MSSETNNSQNSSVTPFELLKTQVYPVLNEAMLKLIDHIVKTQQVRKHQERLVKQKLLDQLQKKKIQRQKQKEELGSDYFESDDEQYYRALKMDKKQVQAILDTRIKRNDKKKSASENHNNKSQPINSPDSFNPISYLVQQLKLIRSQKLAQKKN